MRPRRHPAGPGLMPVAIVIPRVFGMVPPPGILPLCRGLGGRLLLRAFHCRGRNYPTEWRHRWRLRSRRRHLRTTHRTTSRAETTRMEHRLMHLLGAPAAHPARGICDCRLNAVSHQRVNQSRRSIHGSRPLGGGRCAPGRALGDRSASSPPDFAATIASICSACLFNRNRPAIRDCKAA